MYLWPMDVIFSMENVHVWSQYIKLENYLPLMGAIYSMETRYAWACLLIFSQPEPPFFGHKLLENGHNWSQ